MVSPATPRAAACGVVSQFCGDGITTVQSIDKGRSRSEGAIVCIDLPKMDGHQRLVFQLSPIRPEVSKWELTESRQTILKKVFPFKIIGFFSSQSELQSQDIFL
jgi:hypothetical protein